VFQRQEDSPTPDSGFQEAPYWHDDPFLVAYSDALNQQPPHPTEFSRVASASRRCRVYDDLTNARAFAAAALALYPPDHPRVVATLVAYREARAVELRAQFTVIAAPAVPADGPDSEFMLFLLSEERP
jgi:hypothetical protein